MQGKYGRGRKFPVRDCKAGRHKRSSSKATAGSLGKYFAGINCHKVSEKFCRKLLWENVEGNILCNEFSNVFCNMMSLQLLTLDRKNVGIMSQKILGHSS